MRSVRRLLTSQRPHAFSVATFSGRASACSPPIVIGLLIC